MERHSCQYSEMEGRMSKNRQSILISAVVVLFAVTPWGVESTFAAQSVKRDFIWLQFEEDFDIIVELEGLVA